MAKTPDYLQIEEGHIIVTLNSGVTIDGAKVKTITMREPQVRDNLAADAVKGSDAQKEIAMFANLCGLAPSDFDEMTSRDYTRLQRAYVNFID